MKGKGSPEFGAWVGGGILRLSSVTRLSLEFETRLQEAAPVVAPRDLVARHSSILDPSFPLVI